MAQQMTLQDYRMARREIRYRDEMKAFRIHGIVYVCVNALLATANLLFVPQFLWFFFPLGGWGFGLAMHYFMGVRRMERLLDAEEERIEDQAGREK